MNFLFPLQRNHKSKGFSYLDLMVAIVIVSIVLLTNYKLYQQLLVSNEVKNEQLKFHSLLEEYYSSLYTKTEAEINSISTDTLQTTPLVTCTHTHSVSPFGTSVSDISCKYHGKFSVLKQKLYFEKFY